MKPDEHVNCRAWNVSHLRNPVFCFKTNMRHIIQEFQNQIRVMTSMFNPRWASHNVVYQIMLWTFELRNPSHIHGEHFALSVLANFTKSSDIVIKAWADNLSHGLHIKSMMNILHRRVYQVTIWQSELRPPVHVHNETQKPNDEI